jgi:hypothetical protein
MRCVLAGITVGLLCLGCDQLDGTADKKMKALEARVDELQQKVTATSRVEVGRYQVVNPTPQFIRNSILLDTVTGHTWITCTIQDEDGKPIPGTESNGWCRMTQATGRGID